MFLRPSLCYIFTSILTVETINWTGSHPHVSNSRILCILHSIWQLVLRDLERRLHYEPQVNKRVIMTPLHHHLSSLDEVSVRLHNIYSMRHSGDMFILAGQHVCIPPIYAVSNSLVGY